MSCIKIAPNFYPEVVLLNCVRIFTVSLPRPTLTPPFPLFLCFHVVQYARGPRSPPSHLPLSLAAESPSRDLLKWNIWFHFEVPKHLNHLARKDAGRVVKLLCLAAGSPSADREHKGEERYHQAPGISPLDTGVRECCHHWLFLFSLEP